MLQLVIIWVLLTFQNIFAFNDDEIKKKRNINFINFFFYFKIRRITCKENTSKAENNFNISRKNQTYIIIENEIF